LHAEDSFSKQYPRRSVGWAILDVVAYPDLVPYQNDKVEYPIQIIGAHKQVLDLDYTVKEG
jgi:hypothetical protein